MKRVWTDESGCFTLPVPTEGVYDLFLGDGGVRRDVGSDAIVELGEPLVLLADVPTGAHGDFVYPEPASLVLKSAGIGGPFEYCKLDVWLKAAGGGAARSQLALESRRCDGLDIRGVAPGTYTLEARLGASTHKVGGVRSDWVFLLRGLSLPAGGRASVPLEFTHGYVVTGELRRADGSPVADRPIFLDGGNDYPELFLRPGRTTDSGTFRFANVPSWTYHLVLRFGDRPLAIADVGATDVNVGTVTLTE